MAVAYITRQYHHKSTKLVSFAYKLPSYIWYGTILQTDTLSVRHKVFDSEFYSVLRYIWWKQISISYYKKVMCQMYVCCIYQF